MTRTEKMGLSLPAGNDYVDIQVLSENFRKIDEHTHDPDDLGAATTEIYAATVPAAWIQSGGCYYQDIAVNGILEADTPIVDIKPGEDNDANIVYAEAYSKVFRITTFANKVRVWATEAIETAFPIQLKVVR